MSPNPSLMHRLMRYLVWGASAFAGLILLYMLGALTGALIITGKTTYAGDHEGIEIFVRGSVSHAEFVVPVRTKIHDWSVLTPPEDFRELPHSATHVAFGWGERDFFLNVPRWGDFDIGFAVKAVMFSGDTVLHVEHLRAPVRGPWVQRLVLSQDQYRALVGYIVDRFRLRGGKPTPIPDSGYGLGDVFYEAKGTYSPLFTCNDWVNKGLKMIGAPAALWAPFSYGVRRALRQADH